MRKSLAVVVILLAGFGVNSLFAQNVSPGTADAAAGDLDSLKARISDQQAQIRKLQEAVDEQQKLLEHTLQTMAAAQASKTTQAATAQPVANTSDGTNIVAASTTNVAGPVRFIPAIGGRQKIDTPGGRDVTAGGTSPCDEGNPAPTFIRLGNVCITPVGFMDLIPFWRSANAGSSFGSNFGSVPYNNNLAAHNSEFRFTPQNSRIGFRIDGDWKGAHFLAYNEFDFLGTSGATNLTVSNGAFVPRLRLFWVDVRKGKVEFLAGQSWTMLTPNRTGISALPGDLFYGQAIDANYLLGLTWDRQPGMRVLLHPSEKLTIGFSVENPDQYMGGANGSTAITLPSALTALQNTQLDAGGSITATASGSGATTVVTAAANTVLATPTYTPDVIAKIAFDPSSRFHFEVAGIESQYRIFNPNTGAALGAQQHFSTSGGGLQFGANAAVTKNLRLITTNFWTDGDGRYIFGQVPDVIVRANGALSGVHAESTVDGFEATIHKTLIYGYWGAIRILKNVAIDANGKSLIGYGYAGTNSQNRLLQEGTFGFNQTMWKNPKYGAINVMGQYEWLSRSPFAAAVGAPVNAHDNTILFDIRYSLPGSAPKF
jgi:hypothetical protein